MKRNAAMYCRLSKDRDGNMLGIARQEEDCRALAARKGWEITEVFIDDDVSAYVPGKRPSFEAMLEAIEQRAVDAVVVYDEDRLVRHPFELEGFFMLCQKVGLTDLASVSGESDLSNPDDQLMLRVKGAVAKKSSDDSSRRYKRMHLQIAQSGRWSGGPRPYGYDVHRNILGEPMRDGRLVVLPEEAKIVLEAAERVQAGESLHSICGDLNQRRVSTAQGASWRTPTLKRILTGPTHAGKRAYQNEILGDAIWPAIIDEATHRRLGLLLTNPSRSVGRRARVFLLSGAFGRCGLCGAKLVGQRRHNGTRTYVCLNGPGGKGCGGIACVAEPLEALVTDAVMIRLDTPALARVLADGRATGPKDDDASQQVVAMEAKLAELADMWAADEISRAEWSRARVPIEARRDAAERQLSAVVRRSAVARWEGEAGVLRSAWPQMNLDQKRAVVDAVVERVVVNPTKIRGRFDPERVDVIWRA